MCLFVRVEPVLTTVQCPWKLNTWSTENTSKRWENLYQFEKMPSIKAKKTKELRKPNQTQTVFAACFWIRWYLLFLVVICVCIIYVFKGLLHQNYKTKYKKRKALSKSHWSYSLLQCQWITNDISQYLYICFWKDVAVEFFKLTFSQYCGHQKLNSIHLYCVRVRTGTSYRYLKIWQNKTLIGYH